MLFTNEALTQICKKPNIKLSEQCNAQLYENTQYIRVFRFNGIGKTVSAFLGN